MANEQEHGHDARKDEPKRRGGAVGGAPAVADDDDGLAFAGMAGMGVVAAIIVSMLWLSGFFSSQDTGTTTAAVATTEHEMTDEGHDDDEAVVVEEEEEAAVEETTTTEAETTTTEAETTTTEAAATGAAATIDATQAGIVLAGTVPSEAAAERLRAAATAAGYTEAQITDELVVEDGGEPFTLTVTGSTTDGVLYQRLTDEITDIGNNLEGVEVDNGFTQEESSDLEAALNGLDPVQFESGTDVITADTVEFVDAAAELLTANPDVTVEVGGHTDSRGNDASNQSLSERRAQAVVAALVERGVSEDQLVAVGYGENRLLIDPDDTAEQQQQNRRIEYRIL